MDCWRKSEGLSKIEQVSTTMFLKPCGHTLNIRTPFSFTQPHTDTGGDWNWKVWGKRHSRVKLRPYQKMKRDGKESVCRQESWKSLQEWERHLQWQNSTVKYCCLSFLPVGIVSSDVSWRRPLPSFIIDIDLSIYSVSGKLGKGVDLPRLKQAELINTTLEVEMVSLFICTVTLTSDL